MQPMYRHRKDPVQSVLRVWPPDRGSGQGLSSMPGRRNSEMFSVRRHRPPLTRAVHLLERVPELQYAPVIGVPAYDLQAHG